MSSPPNIENFDIVGLLGQGGMATVWKARQRSLDRYVAIKVLAPDFTSHPEDIARFHEEAHTAAQMAHHGIVQVYDAHFQDGSYHFVMEWVNGYTLGQWLRRKGRVPIEEVLNVAESVAEALDYSWRRFHVVHCDIKPDNIMLDADGTVKVADLGLARSISAMARSNGAMEEILGTPAYMSPEQVMGLTDIDCRSDIYSLGATLYHLITGQMLFSGPSDAVMEQQVTGQAPAVRELLPEATLACGLLIEKMLAKNRDHRPRDWKETIKDVQRARRRHPPVGALPPIGASSVRRDPETPQALPVAPTPGVQSEFGLMGYILLAILVAALALAAGWFLSP